MQKTIEFWLGHLKDFDKKYFEQVLKTVKKTNAGYKKRSDNSKSAN